MLYVHVMCVCVCVVIPLILDVRLVDVPAVVIQEEGQRGFLHLSSAVLALIFLARRIQPFLSLVDREVKFCVLHNEIIVLHLWGIYIYNTYIYIYMWVPRYYLRLIVFFSCYQLPPG